MCISQNEKKTFFFFLRKKDKKNKQQNKTPITQWLVGKPSQWGLRTIVANSLFTEHAISLANK